MSEETFTGIGIRQTLRRAASFLRINRGNIRFLLLLIGTPVLVVLIYSTHLGQIHVVEARTLGARITILGPDTVWRLPQSTLCVDLGDKRDVEKAKAYAGSGCNPGIFDEQLLPNAEFRIPSGVQILIRSEPGGGVVLRRLSDRADSNGVPVRLEKETFWKIGSLIRIDAEAWRSMALLEFAGDAVIGQETLA